MYQPPFIITDDILTLVAEISEAIGSLNAIMSDDLPHPLLRKQNRIKTIQSSLAIENNTLNLEQVTAIVDGKHVLGSPAEIQEVRGAIAAYEMVLDVNPHSIKDLLMVHGIMMHNLLNDAGHWRSGGVVVFGEKGCVHLAPPASRVPQLIADLIDWIKTTQTHPLISSCVFHYEFEFIHPFSDGNGRMGRLWQTALLARWKPVFAWLPIETMVKEHQQEYYDIIAYCDKMSDSTNFVLFMLHRIKEAIDKVETPKKTPKKTPKQIIIELIESDTKVSIQQMADAMGMNKRNAQKRVNQLVKDGLIERVGANRGGYWKILKET